MSIVHSQLKFYKKKTQLHVHQLSKALTIFICLSDFQNEICRFLNTSTCIIYFLKSDPDKTKESFKRKILDSFHICDIILIIKRSCIETKHMI